MSDQFIHDFNRLLNASWRASERSSWTYGRLGDRSQNWAINSVERPGFVYVSLGIDGGGEIVIARNDFVGLPKTKQLPVKMREESGVWVIHGVDVNASSPTDYLTGPGGNIYGVAPHTHRLDSGLSYPLESLRFEPARLTWAGGMLVDIFTFRYRAGGGVWKTWFGGTIDLTDAIPLTTGEWGWVLVCIDTDTNTAASVPGPTQVYALPLTAAQIDDIVPPDTFIPCGAVKIRNDATEIGDFSTYAEARGWLNIPQSFNSIGEIPDVETSAPADGDVLMYSSFDSIWHATPLQIPLDDLIDVVAPTPSVGDLMMFDGTNWVNASPDIFVRADGTIPLADEFGDPVLWDAGPGSGIALDIIRGRNSIAGGDGTVTFYDGVGQPAFGVGMRGGTFRGFLEILGGVVRGPQEPTLGTLIHMLVSAVSYYVLQEAHVEGGDGPVTILVGLLSTSPTAVCHITYAVKSDISGANGGGSFALTLSDTEVVTIGAVSWTFTMAGTGQVTVEQTAGSDAIADFLLVILYL